MGCLENGGRCLARKKLYTGHFRSRRLLHSAFWSHGAGDIDLPSWWVLLLRLPQNIGPCLSATATDSAFSGTSYHFLDGEFLDFLYPGRTWALLQSFVRNDTLRKGFLSQRLRHRSRTYTSDASDILVRYGKESVNDEASAGEVCVLPVTEGTSRDQTASRDQELGELDGLLALNNPKLHAEEVWSIYTHTRDASLPLSSTRTIRLLHYLSMSLRSTDLERCRSLFDEMRTSERRAIHYSHTINAMLKLGDLETALAIHREALSRIQGSVGTSRILQYTVEGRNWPVAIRTWNEYWDHKQLYFERPDLWAGVDSLPFPEMMNAAKSAAEYAVEMAEASVDEAIKVRDFALQLIMRTFKAVPTEIELRDHRDLFDKAARLKEPSQHLFETAIHQLLATEDRACKDSAIAYYTNMKRNTNLVPSKDLLHAIIRMFSDTHNGNGAQMILQDFRQYHGSPTAFAYRQSIQVLASKGRSQEVEEVLLESLAQYRTLRDVRVLNSLLYASYIRADQLQVVQNFQRLSVEFGVTPDLTSWNTVIKTFTRVNDVEGSIDWYERLRSSGLRPDAGTFSSLMAVHTHRGDADAVAALLRVAADEGIQADVNMINQEVQLAVNNDQLDDAYRLIQSSTNVTPDRSKLTRMWNSLLAAYAMRRDLESVSGIQKAMEDTSVPFNGQTYAILMQALAIKKQSGSAWNILKLIRKQKQVEVTAFHYAIVMGGFLATEEYIHIFHVYKSMIKHNVAPSLSTQNMLIRAAARIDMERTTQDNLLVRAQSVLDETLANLDPGQLTPLGPSKSLGTQTLDIATTSSYFQYLIFVYGERKSFDHVSELWDRYVERSMDIRPGIDVRPPVEMLSALMVTHLHQHEHEEVERCWYLAAAKMEQLTRRSKTCDISKPGWVNPARRFMLSRPLHIYLDSLSAQQKVDNMISTVTEHRASGYELVNRTWNLYVKSLALNDRPRQAFETCERELIQDWPGWEYMKVRPWRLISLKRNIRNAQPDKLGIYRRLPEYPTLVALAAAYINVRSRSSGRTEVSEAADLSRIAPKTMETVVNLPKLDDHVQAEFLGGYDQL